MTTFLTICLLVMPWFILPIRGLSNQMRLPQMMFLGITYFGMICLFFLNGSRYVYRNKWLALLSGWLFLSILTSFFIPFCLEWENVGRAINVSALEQVFFIITGLFVSYIALTYFEKDDYVRIAKALCLSTSLMACWAILQYIGFDPFGKIAVYRCGNRVSACLDNPNLVANYLALCLPLFFMFSERKYVIGVLLTSIAIGLTRSHFGWGLAFLGIFVFCMQNYTSRYCRIGLLSTIPIGIFSIIKFDLAKLVKSSAQGAAGALSGRWDCWKVAVSHLKDNPLFGQGLGCWKTWEVKVDSTYWLYVHNDWLEKAIEIGLIGILLIALVIINSIRNFNFTDRVNFSYFSMFIVFLVMMFFSFPLVAPTIGFLGLISWWSVEKL